MWWASKSEDSATLEIINDLQNVVKFHECAFWNNEEGAHPLWGPNLRNFKWPLEDRSR